MITINNPIAEGWYADPEARKYNGKYYIYVTQSKPFEEQHNLDMFSSDDLVNWEKHENIICMEDFPHVKNCVWAPTVIEKNGKYYLIFASNNIHTDEEEGGLEIAVSDTPEGPFHSFIKGSLIGEFHNGAQPIDAHLFKDEDETVWLYYGGWSHCNVCRMSEDMTKIVPLEEGSDETVREITPKDYTEAPCMLKYKGKYFFMWSGGGWVNGSYHVSYAVSDSPLGKFEDAVSILETQLPVADGPGHHGYLYLEESDEFLIVYHRRIPGDTDWNHRILCIDKMKVCDGSIEPVTMTHSFELDVKKED